MAFESVTAASPRVRPPVTPLARRVVLMLAAVFTAANVDPVLLSINRGARWVAHGFRTSESIAFFGLTSLAVHTLALVLVGVVAISTLRYVRAWRHLPLGTVAVRADERGLHVAGDLTVESDEIAEVEVMTDPSAGFALVVTRQDGQLFRLPLAAEADAHALARALSPEHDASTLIFEGLADPRTQETRAAVVAASLIAVLATAHLITVPYLMTGWIRHWAPAPRHWGEHPERLQYWLLWVQRFSALPVGAVSIFAVGAIVRRLVPGRVLLGPTGLRLGGAHGRAIDSDEIVSVELVKSWSVELMLRSGERVRLKLAFERPKKERDEFVTRVKALVASGASGRRLVDPATELGHEALDRRPALGG